jgi:hypothetical protein
VKLYRTIRRQNSPEVNGNDAKCKQLTRGRQPGQQPLSIETEESALLWIRYQETHSQDRRDLTVVVVCS